MKRAKDSRLTVEVVDRKEKTVRFAHSYVGLSKRLPAVKAAKEEALSRAIRNLKLKRSQLTVRVAKQRAKAKRSPKRGVGSVSPPLMRAP